MSQNNSISKVPMSGSLRSLLSIPEEECLSPMSSVLAPSSNFNPSLRSVLRQSAKLEDRRLVDWDILDQNWERNSDLDDNGSVYSDTLEPSPPPPCVITAAEFDEIRSASPRPPRAFEPKRVSFGTEKNYLLEDPIDRFKRIRRANKLKTVDSTRSSEDSNVNTISSSKNGVSLLSPSFVCNKIQPDFERPILSCSSSTSPSSSPAATESDLIFNVDDESAQSYPSKRSKILQSYSSNNLSWKSLTPCPTNAACKNNHKFLSHHVGFSVKDVDEEERNEWLTGLALKDFGSQQVNTITNFNIRNNDFDCVNNDNKIDISDSFPLKPFLSNNNKNENDQLIHLNTNYNTRSNQHKTKNTDFQNDQRRQTVHFSTPCVSDDIQISTPPHSLVTSAHRAADDVLDSQQLNAPSLIGSIFSSEKRRRMSRLCVPAIQHPKRRSSSSTAVLNSTATSKHQNLVRTGSEGTQESSSRCSSSDSLPALIPSAVSGRNALCNLGGQLLPAVEPLLSPFGKRRWSLAQGGHFSFNLGKNGNQNDFINSSS